ncbi:aminopeptidase P family protein [Microlunatus antarcticus]|uniref:Xaa-Pro aminopeptidase n=1 Tax=Microlunatus antarcticus TaxID=53388 RepID=A0A7W5JY29_9ACTN|nr:aminopeptidase P family protein [Microlunatus antarcticus]MBB3328471.1 Xaa-Pro aminopeptidase [Microlunatus antarcticus]
MSEDVTSAITSEEPPVLPNRAVPFSEAFKSFIAQGWAPYPAELPEPLPATASTAARREALGAQFPGERLVIGAGGPEVRSNDTDYRFRPHSAFAHLTGLGTDREPDAVLVLEPTDPQAGGTGSDGGTRGSHDATLYFKPRAPRDSSEFYADARYGEMWVGVRPSLEEMSALTGLRTAPVDELEAHLRKDADTIGVRANRADLTTELQAVLAEVAPLAAPAAVADGEAEVTDQAKVEAKTRDAELMTALSELRLVKDAYEADEMREACTLTGAGFEAVVADLPRAAAAGRGERWVEGVFGLHARHVGNAVGYDTIAAAGDHACTLHWIRNDGDLRMGDLLLLDAGVELDSLYTADVTRTLPVSGTFSEPQRRVYEAVLAAQEAGIAAAQPGATFAEVHRASIRVIAEHLDAWGLLPVPLEEALSEEGGQHRRWMPHGTSHHLGIDVHDCAEARRENYREGVLAPGMVITVEPGLYFKSDDELAPAELRGIGVRIEDDILITDDGNENLSDLLPRTVADVEAWMADVWHRQAVALAKSGEQPDENGR